MIIVNVKGGLGNQMYQYALYLALRKAGKDARLSLLHFEDVAKGKWKNIPAHGQKFLLEELFGVSYEAASARETRRLGSVRMNLLARLMRKKNIYKKTHLREEKIKDCSLDYLLSADPAFLDGYWQSFSYSKDVSDEVRAAFTFRQPLTGQNAEYAEQMASCNSISLHVRRTDYLHSTMYAILDADYYKRAMSYLAERTEAPHFFCFSDDMDWCNEHLSSLGYPITFVQGNTGSNSYLDMRLMGLCRHHIVANSTFSIWGAFLDGSQDAIVVRPEHYFSPSANTQPFAWPEGWTVI